MVGHFYQALGSAHEEEAAKALSNVADYCGM
jgi:hypothetical protein